MSITPVLVVAGVGNAAGTGAATARLFSKAGYSVALVARNKASLKSLSDELNSAGGKEAEHFAVDSYSHQDIASVFARIRERFPAPSFSVRAALFNVGPGTWSPFLNLTPDQIRETLDTNVVAAFAFAREALLQFKQNEIDTTASLGGKGKRGTLMFTGATASLRGNTTTSLFAAAKHGVRALSQSLAKEFGKDNIHVAHAIIDGRIATGRAREQPGFEESESRMLSPESIAKSYLYLANQDSSAMTWELDLRPAQEKW